MDTLPPHHSPLRNWLVKSQSDPSLRYEAFRGMAEARGLADALAILDDADGRTLAAYPLRRIEATEEVLNRLLVELEDVAARLHDRPPPDARGRVFYEPPDVFQIMHDTYVDGLWLDKDLFVAGLGGAVEAVFRGVASRLDPEALARIPLLRAWWPAVEKGDVDAVRGLLDRGVPIDTRDRWRMTALDHAARAGAPAMIRLLLDRGADPNAEDSTWTPVTAAARWTERGVVEMLVAAGGRVGLREAVLMGDVDLAREILDADPTIDVSANARFVYSFSFLMLAVSKSDLNMARFLIDRGADLESTEDEFGWPALTIAAIQGDKAIVELLLGRGADIDHEDWSGRTALADAAASGHDEVVILLVGRGARRGLPDAAYLGDEALVARLLADGADPGREPNFAKTPLRIAVQRGYTAIVARLLEAGPVENVRGYGSDRSLVAEAAATGRLDVVRLLVDRGLDPRETGDDGLTPLDWAEREGRAEVADYLRGLG